VSARCHTGGYLRACGQVQIKSSGGLLQGNGLALAGLILGYASIFLMVVLLLLYPLFNSFKKAMTRPGITPASTICA